MSPNWSRRCSGNPLIAPQNFTEEQAQIAGDWRDLHFTRMMVQHPSLYRSYMPWAAEALRAAGDDRDLPRQFLGQTGSPAWMPRE